MKHYYLLLRLVLLTAVLCLNVLLTASAQNTACRIPYFLNVTQVTATSASVTSSDFSIWNTHIVTYAPLGAPASAALTVTSSTLPIALTGLTPNTTYQASFRVVCSTTNQTSPTLSLTFDTSCPAVTAYPYAENFDGPLMWAAPCGYTVLDANNDGYGWSSRPNFYSSAPNTMAYSYSPNNQGNDWLFTRGLQMQAGQAYQLQFKYRAYLTAAAEALEVKLGAAATPAGQTYTLFKNTNITNNTYNTTVAGGAPGQVLSYTPASSGTYYIGFHAISAPDRWYLFLDDVLVTSSVITANRNTTAAGFGAQATPVPFGTTLNLSLTTPKAGLLQLTLRDAVGRTVRQATATAALGSNTVVVPGVASLPTGVYFLTIEQDGTSQTIRVAHD